MLLIHAFAAATFLRALLRYRRRCYDAAAFADAGAAMIMIIMPLITMICC